HARDQPPEPATPPPPRLLREEPGAGGSKNPRQLGRPRREIAHTGAGTDAEPLDEPRHRVGGIRRASRLVVAGIVEALSCDVMNHATTTRSCRRRGCRS